MVAECPESVAMRAPLSRCHKKTCASTQARKHRPELSLP